MQESFCKQIKTPHVGFRAVLYQFTAAEQVYVPVHHKLQVVLICSHSASSCITGAITFSTLFGRFIGCIELSPLVVSIFSFVALAR
jgi:hypothetical protein